jgi:hypothetical protein
MDMLKKNIGRRQFISLGSMALGAGMIARPAGRLFAAEGAPAPVKAAAGDGTKYGEYITLAVNAEPTERGIQMFPVGGSYPGFSSIIAGRMLPPGPMPSHDAPEKHDGEIEYLIHIGNDPDDPLELGADVDFFMGKGKWLEKYELTNTTAVYLPDGLWHCPWKVKKIRTPMNWVNVRVGDASSGAIPPGMPPGAEGGVPGDMPGGAPGGAPGGGMPFGDLTPLSEEAQAAAKTSNYVFDKYLLSGVPKDMQDPVGGKWIAYTDCTKIAGGALTRIIRYRPEKAPYNIIDRQTHEYGSIFFFLGTDHEDCSKLGAKVELLIGPEKERHVIDKSAMVYVPKETAHGPFKVLDADGQFNFIEIVAGPELPGAV